MQNAADLGRIKHQIVLGVAALMLFVSLGAGFVAKVAFDHRPVALAHSSVPTQPLAVPPAHAAGTLIKASVADFSIKLDRSTVPAGKMTFRVANLGPSFHEFVILKTNHPAGKLPIIKQEGYMRAAEDAKGDVNVAELGGIKVGGSKDLTTTLKPGHYVIVCNLPMHYKMGMRTAFTVEPKHAASAQPAVATKAAGTLIKSSVADFSIKLDRSTVPAGKMTFSVANLGPSFHEFVILKTNHPAANLPIIKQEGYMRAAEDAKGDLHVAELGGIKVGGSKDLTTTLKPGHYVIVCNLPMHYKLGMQTAFTVR
jgi:uncharacterized cupredoxin-like copper-binding protein